MIEDMKHFVMGMPAAVSDDSRVTVSSLTMGDCRTIAAWMTPRPLAEWSEEDGDVLWWALETVKCTRCDGDGWINEHENLPDVPCPTCLGKERIPTGRWMGEPPYVGCPNDLGYSVYVDVTVQTQFHGEIDAENADLPPKRYQVGGWPGYHTHWTPLPKVTAP